MTPAQVRFLRQVAASKTPFYAVDNYKPAEILNLCGCVSQIFRGRYIITDKGREMLAEWDAKKARRK